MGFAPLYPSYKLQQPRLDARLPRGRKLALIGRDEGGVLALGQGEVEAIVDRLVEPQREFAGAWRSSTCEISRNPWSGRDLGWSFGDATWPRLSLRLGFWGSGRGQGGSIGLREPS